MVRPALWVPSLSALLGAFVPLAARGQTITEYPLPSGFFALPAGITAGPDGNLWFCEAVARRVARIAPSGELVEFPVNGTPDRITLGPDGNLWFTEFENRIGRMSVGGSFVEFPLPPAEVPRAPRRPAGITAGPDGHLWYSDSATGNRIGKMTGSGQLVEFPIPTPNASPNAIALGSDGNLWFTELGANQIGRITPQGVITEFPLPTPTSTAVGIAAGPDGNLWFTEYFGKLGRINASGQVTEFSVPSENSTPWDITLGPDGALWFTEKDGNRIGRITTDGVISEYPIPTPNSEPQGIASGPDGNIWFTEWLGGKVGRLSLRADTCSGDSHAICLGGRFRASVNWHTSTGADTAAGIPLGADAGAFWFFSANNIELAVKVVDGRTFNERFWLFYGSMTNVGFTLTVTDTQTGRTKTYTNPDGTLASVADTDAF